MKPWLVTILLTGCYMLSIIDRQVIAFVALDIKRDLAISDFELGLVQGFAFSIFYAAAGIPLGWAIDRFPRTRLIAGALIIWSGMTICCGFARGFASLALSRIGVGAGEAVLTPGAYSIMSDSFPRRHFATASMIYSLGAPFAAAGAAWLSATMLASAADDGTVILPLIGPIAGWRAVFLVAGAPGIVLALLVLAIREPRRQGGSGESEYDGALLPFLRQNWTVHLVFAASSMLTVVIHYCFAAWSPAILGRVFAWNPAQIGAALGMIAVVCGILGCLLGGVTSSWLLRRERPSSMLRVAGIAVGVTALSGLAAPFLSTGGQFVATVAVAGIATPLLLMVGPTLLQVITPAELRGRMTATFMFINVGLGAGAGPSLVGALSTYFFRPDQLALALGCVVAGAGLLAAIGFLSLVGSVDAYVARMGGSIRLGDQG
ncbi:MFS transporter [Rhizorhabdus histidinilytica]|uniref:MFS transporter n=1 Tax=Rhizorhabdus histidinilytica TaxID=439228 RepID=UPI00321FC054